MKCVYSQRKGFTLIELVMVIVIIGVLAAVSIPFFVNLSRSARDSAEAGVIGALRSAVAIQYSKNMMNGAPAWPGGNPLDLLASGPPSVIVTSNWALNSNDGVTWRVWLSAGQNEAWLYSPHWNGDWFGAGATAGHIYYYETTTGGIRTLF